MKHMHLQLELVLVGKELELVKRKFDKENKKGEWKIWVEKESNQGMQPSLSPIQLTSNAYVQNIVGVSSSPLLGLKPMKHKQVEAQLVLKWAWKIA